MAIVTNIILVLLLMATFLSPGADSLGTTVIEGDVYIELVSSIYSKLHENGTCYDVDPESVQNVEAIRWVLTELNKKHISDGNKGIGLKVSETCRSLDRVENLMFDLVIEMKNSDKQTVIGVLGTDYSTESEVVSRLLSALPAWYRLPLVSWSSTSESLARRDVYNNFIRTIPSDAVQTQVMTSFMKKLNWTRMAIVHGDGAYGQGGKAALLEEARGPDICFPVAITIGNEQNIQDVVQTQLMENIFSARIPINGILVFGHSNLADAVLTAVNTIVDTYPNISRPALLFSEASGEIQGNSTLEMRGLYVLSPPRRNMKEFYDSYANLFKSPETIYNLPEIYRRWIKDVYFSKFGCELPASATENTCPLVNDAEAVAKIHHSIYDQYAIQAALTIATIERNVRQKLCPSMDFCAALYESPRQVYLDQTRQLSVNFDDFVGVRISAFREPKDLVIEFSGSADAALRDDFPLYEVYSHQMCDVTNNTSCIVKVAHLSANEFVVDTSSIRDYDEQGRERLWPDISKPQCPNGYKCSACLEQEDYDSSLLFEPGDFYIVGVVPVHLPGDSPLQCGAIKSGMLDIVEAIRFAIAEAKLNYADKVPSGTIGTIIIDSCNDKQMVQERIISLHRLGVYRNGEYITVGDKILGYVGGFTSDVSATLADIATRLGSAQISYASTATTLSIRSVYPNFLRIPSSDDFQAQNILNIINEIGVNLIQIIYSDSVYGENGKHAILDHATSSSMHVCIAHFHKFTINDGSSKIIYALNKTKSVKVVVLFLSSFDIERLLPALSSAFDKGEFVFISSDGWGRRMDVSDYHNMEGSVTLTPELPMNEKFEQHLKQLRPDGSDLNHWIRPYMENFFECYYEWNYNKESGKPCTVEEALDVFNTAYRVDVWSPFAEKAVLALLQGSKKVLDEKCGQSDSVCDEFRNDTSSLVNAIKDVTFSDGSGNQVPMFDKNGDGTAGYKFYVLEMVDGKVRYTKIGASDPTFVFDLQSYQQVVTVDSWCSGQEVCRKCFPTIVQSEEATAYPVWLVVMFVVTSIACIGLAGFLIFTCCKHGCCLLIENGRVKFVSDYISPIYRKNAADKAARENTGNYDMIGNVERHVYMCQNCKTCIGKDASAENTTDTKPEYFIPYAGAENEANHNNGNNAISNPEQKPVSKQDTCAISESIPDPVSGENYIIKGSELNALPDSMGNDMINSGDNSRVSAKNDGYFDSRVVLRGDRSQKADSCNSYLIGDICEGDIPAERSNENEEINGIEEVVVNVGESK